MNEMQAHGLLIPVGSKPFEVWIDKNNSLAELQDLVNGNVHEKSTKSLAEVATEARESSLVLSQDEGNHDDSGSDIGNSRPIDREYPIGH